MNLNADELAKRIDHTLLASEATSDAIDRLCDEALEFGFGAVCVNPVYVCRVAKRFEQVASGGRPSIVSVAGFPLGASATSTKVEEAIRAVGDGATEIDMVAPIGPLIAGDRTVVRRDIESVAGVVHSHCRDGVLKVILETAVLPTDRIILGCRLCAEGEADFVKSSTGYHPSGGATVEHVRLLYRCASPLLVKAAGGIRSAGAACAMIDAGAARIGTSAGIAIVQAQRSVTG